MLDAETTSRIGSGRHSTGIEIDPDYCRMIQTRLRSENQDLFSSARLEFAAAKASESAARLVGRGDAVDGTSRSTGPKTGQVRGKGVLSERSHMHAPRPYLLDAPQEEC